MTTTKKINVAAITLFAALLMISCSGQGNKKQTGEQDSTDTETGAKITGHNQLKAFMLGGIYFINGYGGLSNTESMMADAGYTSDEEIISGYEQIFLFPFDPAQQGSDIKQVLSRMWDVNSKEELLKKQEELKTQASEHKAWDYARLVNNACMGYAAGYLTKEEATQLVEAVLPLAQEKYTDWNAYYNDFNLGRQEWNSEDPEKESFEEIAAGITKNPKSIYNILPLK